MIDLVPGLGDRTWPVSRNGDVRFVIAPDQSMERANTDKQHTENESGRNAHFSGPDFGLDQVTKCWAICDVGYCNRRQAPAGAESYHRHIAYQAGQWSAV